MKIVPICIMVIAFCFIKWVPISSFGMIAFWGILLIAAYNAVVTRKLLKIKTEEKIGGRKMKQKKHNNINSSYCYYSNSWSYSDCYKRTSLFKTEDVKQITNEVFDNQPVKIQAIEVYKDAISITTTEISEEQKTNLVNKFHIKMSITSMQY